ncbi:deoxyribodipyrimidine photo-lyase, partial [Kitasatospora indigofera]|uniref:deoxyribodipyrimidine photo-lyase n=1 Tax=Kitasatospora indigofera TaxID=67307 RepID=UPI003690C15E
MITPPALLCFRDDLRLGDNPALTAAVDSGAPVIAVYVLDEESAGVRPLGAAARWWLHQSLASLRDGLDELGIPLVLRRGRTQEVIAGLAAESGATSVFWNRRYGLAERSVDAALKSELRASGLAVQSFAASLLFEPWTITTGAGAPYAVFTPYWRRIGSLPEPRLPLPTPAALPAAEARASAGLAATLGGDALDDWGLQPRPDWAG